MNYAQIRRLDISNGEGLGISLFVQGCDRHCYNCFNPETWDFSKGSPWTEDVKDSFIDLLDRPNYKRVTILGGEPLCKENCRDVAELISEIRGWFDRDKKIWVYTGNTLEFFNVMSDYYKFSIDGFDQDTTEIIEYIINEVDFVVDGAYREDLRNASLPYRGSSNQRIIDIQKSLESGRVELWNTST